jgi:RNA polymerase subunit RPABC4/transcription elongation factor Spt4
MAFCPYCREIIGSNVTTCPSCGMSWQDQQQAQPQQAQGYQQPQQAPPPQQPAYQQPPPTPQQQETRLCVQCGRSISLQYNLCPYCGKQVAKQPTAQPPPPQQPPPQPGYQQPPPAYGPQPEHLLGKVGLGSVISALVGGIMAIIGSLILYMHVSGGAWDFASVQDIGRSDYVYAWLIPISGILVIVLAIVAFAMQNKAVATVGGVFGLMILLFALILPLHIGSDSGNIVDGFFYSSSYAGYTSVTFYLGGFIALVAGINAMAACFGLSRKIKKAQMPRYPAYPPQQPPYRPY